MYSARKRTLAIATLAGLGLAAVHPLYAQSQAYTFTSSPTKNDFGTSLGFSFLVNQNIEVTSLGFLDTVANTDHTVGIFDAATDGLVAPSVSVHVSSDYSGGTPTFTFTKVAPITLLQGHTYVIAGTNAGNLYTVNANGFSSDSRITYEQAKYNTDPNGLNYLDQTFSANNIGNFGPNFQIAPEPSSVAAFAFTGLGALGLMLRARKRQSLTA